MKKFIVITLAVVMLIICQHNSVYGTTNTNYNDPATVLSTNEVSSYNSQNMQGQGYGYGYGEGGSANATGGNSVSDADSIAVSGDSGAVANISTNSTSNYESRTPPISVLPPYLPTFSHGGWGTIQGYFPNGPTAYDKIYERAFYPGNKSDMKELKDVMTSLSYEGPLSLVGGLLNGIGTLLGGPDNFHHGRGFEISSSVIRERRPQNKPLIILIDSQINRDYLKTTGFAYAGKVSIEGKVNRNWDQVYKAAIAEALPWDVDIILVSGGMKGVTVGSNTTFPSAGGAYAQTNYSMTLLGGYSTGITEGKGEAMVSAECYRYNPQAVQTRAIPEQFYERVHMTSVTGQNTNQAPQIQNSRQPSIAPAANRTQTNSIQPVRTQTQAQAQVPVKQQDYVGVNVSHELYEMAGF